MDWKRIKNISAEAAKVYIYGHRLDSFTILDVSQPSEYDIGHIPGARLIPLPTLPERLNELSLVKPTIVY